MFFRPVGCDFTFPHQVHFLLGLFQQCLFVLKLRGVHVLVNALVLSIRKAGQR